MTAVALPKADVSKKEKIRNRYNQVPHLIQDITWKRVKNTKQTSHTREPRG